MDAPWLAGAAVGALALVTPQTQDRRACGGTDVEERHRWVFGVCASFSGVSYEPAPLMLPGTRYKRQASSSEIPPTLSFSKMPLFRKSHVGTPFLLAFFSVF